MGTRGAVGFRASGKDYLTYNHWDSYPEGLGVKVEEFIRDHLNWEGEVERNLRDLKTQVTRLKVIDSDSKPTAEDIAALAPYTDLGVGEQSREDWYCLTRHCQGDLAKTLESGYILADNNFINDSLFCEWAYIINADDETLEIYKGFQSKAHKKGRYGKLVPKDSAFVPKYEGETRYYPCALLATIPLADIAAGPIDWVPVECGRKFEHCGHKASEHFPEVTTDVSTAIYLGYAKPKFDDAIAFIYRGVRHEDTGNGGQRQIYGGVSHRRRWGGSMKPVKVWESKATDPQGVEISIVTAHYTPSGKMKPAPGVTWVFPPTKANPSETLYTGKRPRETKPFELINAL